MVVGQRQRTLTRIAIAVGVVILLLWSLAPIYWIFVTSLKPEGEVYAFPPTVLPQAPTLQQYAAILFHTAFPMFVRNSIIVAVIATAASGVISTLAASAI